MNSSRLKMKHESQPGSKGKGKLFQGGGSCANDFEIQPGFVSERGTIGKGWRDCRYVEAKTWKNGPDSVLTSLSP
jgi:hypothetical protein